ncbi:MAG: NAD(P)-binding protein [Chloroflexi bacterium]|nr:NAD(P)-binding protein [Chloroflexota bacterium]
MAKKSEITIAGAGPSGLAAAIILAKAGYHVLVFEQRSRVGERFNDDYQGLENWSRDEDVIDEIRAAGIELSWWSQPYCGGVLYDPSLRRVEIRSPQPLFYMLRRGSMHPQSLDLALYDQAINARVEIIFNRRIDPKAANIVACGPRGIPTAIAAGITFRTSFDDLACAILNDDMAPAGYVYFLVSEGQATLATVLFERFTEVQECMRRSMETIQRLYRVEYDNARHWGGYGSFSIPTTCERDGVLWIGEAAGFQDALFGFGIRNALVSAKLAAQSIIEERSYDELWRDRLLPHLKATAVSRAVYKKVGNVAKRGFWYLTGKNARPDRFMHWLYNFSPAHKLIYPFVTEAI